MRRMVEQLDMPSVFSHNDLLLQNIVINDDEGESVRSIHKLNPVFTCLLMSVCKPLSCSDRAYFIDFEYGAFNYEPYDIANHFNEWAGTVHSVKLMFIVLVSYC